MTRSPGSRSWRELDRALSDVADELQAASVEDMTGAELYIACLAGDSGADAEDIGLDPDAACAEYKRRLRLGDGGGEQ